MKTSKRLKFIFMVVLVVMVSLSACVSEKNNLLNDDDGVFQNDTVARAPVSEDEPQPPIPCEDELEDKVLVLSTSNGIRLVDLKNKSVIQNLDPLSTSARNNLYWSPNGRYVAYEDVRDGLSGIYITDLETLEEVLLRNNDNETGMWEGNFSSGKWISWSSDSSMIAFESVSGYAMDIFIYDIDDQEIQNVTRSLGHEYGLAFSPSGDLLAYIGFQDDLLQIYSVSIDGSEVIQLTDFSELVLINYPTWSPDGKKIAFQTIPDGLAVNAQLITPDLYVMNSDGSSVTQLIRGDDYRCHMCLGILWTPNSKSILFISWNRTDYDIFLVSVETGGVIQLSDENGFNKSAIGWLSDESLLYFEGDTSTNRICMTKIQDWDCKELLEFPTDGLIYHYNVINISK